MDLIIGKIDYGVYKQRGYYFAITMNNAAFGEGITIFVKVKRFMFLKRKRISEKETRTY